MTDQHDPQTPPPASPYGSPTSDSSDVTQATPVTPPTQETPVSSPYGAPSYQPPGYQPPQGQSAPQQSYGQAPSYGQAGYDSGQQSQPYGQAPQQYAPQQPAYGNSTPDYSQQPQQQYGQQGYDAQQQYAQPQQYGQSQPYGQAPQQYGAPAYGATGYGQSATNGPSQPVSSLARGSAVGLILASIIAGVGVFLTWAKLSMTIPMLSSGEISMSANGVGGVNITVPSDSAEMRSFADSASGSTGVTVGWFIFAVAVIVLVLAALLLLGKLSLPAAIGGIVGGLIVTGIAVYELIDVSSSLDDFKTAGMGLSANVSTGIGLWLCLVGGILMLAAGALAVIKRS